MGSFFWFFFLFLGSFLRFFFFFISWFFSYFFLWFRFLTFLFWNIWLCFFRCGFCFFFVLRRCRFLRLFFIFSFGCLFRFSFTLVLISLLLFIFFLFIFFRKIISFSNYIIKLFYLLLTEEIELKFICLRGLSNLIKIFKFVLVKNLNIYFY